jgi:NADH-quinone oxidoreductase subunit J
MLADKVFYFLAFLVLMSGIMVVASRNPVHSVLYLILTFFALSGHYVLLNAQFIAAVNLIVYAGAIMVLFLFVIMFLNLKEEIKLQAHNLVRIAATVTGGMLLVVMVGILKAADLPMATKTANFDNQIGMVERLGKTLFADFLLPFELTSVLFIVALVGAVLLGKREPGERNSF